MIIDAHVHIWTQETDRYPWSPIGDYIPTSKATIELLAENMDAFGVNRAVLVQPTPYGWDNSYLLDSIAPYGHRFRAVCLVDPFSPDGSSNLEELVKVKGVAGLRINWNLQPMERWRESKDHRRLWQKIDQLGIPVCLQLTPACFTLLQEFASSHPGVPIIIDHLARPEPGCSSLSPQFQQFLGLSEYPNIHLKLSGLYYYSTQKPPFEDGWQLVRAACLRFGADRCLWGSDFPFILERWNYSGVIEGIQSRLDLSPRDLERVLGENSLELWWKNGRWFE